METEASKELVRLTPYQSMNLLHEEILRKSVEKNHIFPTSINLNINELPEAIKRSLKSYNFIENEQSQTKIVPCQFIYVVDPYDISSYAFPFGFRFQDLSSKDVQELDTVCDKQAAWRLFFDITPKLVLLDEHKDELIRIRHRLLRDTNISTTNIVVLRSLVNKLAESHIDNKTLEKELIENRLSWLVAASRGELGNGIDRFINVIEKLILPFELTQDYFIPDFVPESEKQHHVDTICRIFDETTVSDWAYYKTEDRKLKAGEKYSDDRIGNLYSDYAVLDRLSIINNKLTNLASDLGCHYIFLYLSSDLKSKSLANEIQNRCATILGNKFNFMRNISQVWTQLLMTYTPVPVKEKSIMKHEDYLTSLNNLFILHNSVINRERVIFSESKNLVKPDDNSLIIQRISILRQQIDWSGLLKNIYSDQAEIVKELKSLVDKTEIVSLKRALTKLYKQLLSQDLESVLEVFNRALRKFNVEVSLMQKILSTLRLNQYPTILAKGYVVGVYHHLPTLLAEVINGSTYDKLIRRLIEIIINPLVDGSYKAQLNEFAKDVLSVLTKSHDEFYNLSTSSDISLTIKYYERQSFLHLFSLIMPFKQYQNDKSNLPYKGIAENQKDIDFDIYDDVIKSDIDSLTTLLNNSNLTSENSHKIRTLILNLFYINIWSLRRNNFLEECYDSIEEMSTFISSNMIDDSIDIRVVQGQTLLNYSFLLQAMYEPELGGNNLTGVGPYILEEKQKYILRSYWNRAHNNSVELLNLFRSKPNFKFADSNAFEKGEFAAINTLIYIKVLGSELFSEQSTDLLLEARNLLDKSYKKDNLERKHSPEFLHTEARLEYLEAGVLANSTSEHLLIEADKKIQFAQSAIDQCVTMQSKLFGQISDPDYDELQELIYKRKIAIRDMIKEFKGRMPNDPTPL